MPSDASDWSLHSQLKKDTIDIGDLPLCKVLVIKDAHYPWLLLVPRRANAVEIIDLDEVAQAIGRGADVARGRRREGAALQSPADDAHQIFSSMCHPTTVMAGLVPAIHVFPFREQSKTWMPGTSPGMTTDRTLQGAPS